MFAVCVIDEIPVVGQCTIDSIIVIAVGIPVFWLFDNQIY